MGNDIVCSLRRQALQSMATYIFRCLKVGSATLGSSVTQMVHCRYTSQAHVPTTHQRSPSKALLRLISYLRKEVPLKQPLQQLDGNATLTFGWMDENYGYLVPLFRDNRWEFLGALCCVATVLAALTTTTYFALKYYRLRSSTPLINGLIQFLWFAGMLLLAISWFKNMYMFSGYYFDRLDPDTTLNYYLHLDQHYGRDKDASHVATFPGDTTTYELWWHCAI
jgi:hypothetical protein